MVSKMFRSALCLAFAGSLFIASGAVLDTIKGVVSDSINGLLIDSVTVSGEGATALSSASGEFTIAVSTTNVEFTAPRYMPALTWRPENGSFSWNGYKGDVSITVNSLKGNIVSRAVSGKNLSGTTFSLARLPQGVYLVAIETQGRQSVYKISSLKTHQTQSFTLMSPGRSPGSLLKAAGTAVAHKLTFTKNKDTLKLTVPAGTSAPVNAKMIFTYPIKNILKLFLDPTIPETGPAESGAQLCLNASTVPERIGGQLKMHDFVLIGENCRRINMVINGKLAWHYDTKNEWEPEDIWVLSNGNVLEAHMKYVEELTPKKEVVFSFPTDGEIHTVLPCGFDTVYYIENHGDASDINIYSKKQKKTIFTKVLKELNGGQHTQCRRLRYTPRGTFLCAAMNANTLYEYDKDWNLVWSFKAGSFWGGISLKNGNYLIQRENATTAVEFKKNGETADSVWGCSIAELKPQLSTLAPDLGAITATQCNERLSNGNTVIFTRYNDSKIPQAIEVTPDKKIVWILQDWQHLGDSVSAFFLDEPGYPEVLGSTGH